MQDFSCKLYSSSAAAFMKDMQHFISACPKQQVCILTILVDFTELLYLKLSFDKTKYILSRVFRSVMVNFDHWFLKTKAFCVVHTICAT